MKKGQGIKRLDRLKKMKNKSFPNFPFFVQSVHNYLRDKTLDVIHFEDDNNQVK